MLQDGGVKNHVSLSPSLTPPPLSPSTLCLILAEDEREDMKGEARRGKEKRRESEQKCTALSSPTEALMWQRHQKTFDAAACNRDLVSRARSRGC